MFVNDKMGKLNLQKASNQILKRVCFWCPQIVVMKLFYAQVNILIDLEMHIKG